MCGIAGIYNFDSSPISFDVLRKMTDVLEHRGPDDSGVIGYSKTQRRFIQPPTMLCCEMGVGARRLKILDLSELGHQPMVNEGDDSCIVFNGAIYNFKELRRDLLAKGYRFRSNCDTEVILSMYREYGRSMLEFFNGMFAIAIYDKKQDILFLARDRLGIKPLYYYRTPRLLMFSSEVKSFLFHPSFRPEVNTEKMSEYMMFRYVAGSETLFKEVYSLPPGHYMEVKDGDPMIVKYWETPAYNPINKPMWYFEDELQDLMHRSLSYRLISDVRVGCQLSGGIDSSLTTLWATQQHNRSMDTISIIFRDKRYSEEEYLDVVTQKLNTVSHKYYMERDFIISSLERVTWHFDFPLNHSSAMGIYLLSKRAKEDVTVLISGEGADEVFGGYARFYLLNYLKLIKMFPFLRMIPGVKERFILTESLVDSMIALTAYGDIGLIPMVFRDFSMEQALETRREIFKKSWESNIFETLLTYEQRTYLVELLLRQDKMCMANAIENRVPFLDYHVVEFSKKIPTDYKVSTKINVLNRNVNYHTKKILKKIALKEFSKDFVYRSKLGFGIPMHEVFCSNGFKGLFNTYKERIKNSNIFDTKGIDILFQDTIKGDPKSIELFWIIFSFGIWHDRFINQRPQYPPT